MELLATCSPRICSSGALWNAIFLAIYNQLFINLLKATIVADGDGFQAVVIQLNLAKLPRDVILIIFSFLSHDFKIISQLR